MDPLGQIFAGIDEVTLEVILDVHAIYDGLGGKLASSPE